MAISIRTRLALASLLVAVAVTAGSGPAGASHKADYPKKHKVFFHLSEPERASQLLTNVQNLVDTVGWQNIDALEVVVHGPALKAFVVKGIDPEVKGKVEVLLTAGAVVDACQTTMRRQSLAREDLVEGLTPVPSGVVRVMELEEKGYAYIRP